LTVGAFIAFIHQPFWVLLFLCYDVPLSTILIDIAVELASAVASFSLLGTFSKTSPMGSPSNVILNSPTNRFLQSSFGIGVMGLVLQFLAKSGYLSWFIVNHFYPVASVEGIHSMSSLTSFFLVLLTGLIVPLLLSTPPRVPSYRTPFRIISVDTTFGRATMLAEFVFLETLSHTFSALQGADFTGCLGYAGGWAAATCILGGVMTWVEQSIYLSPTDIKLMEEQRSSTPA
jgi:hypothetical protein